MKSKSVPSLVFGDFTIAVLAKISKQPDFLTVPTLPLRKVRTG